MSTRCVVKIQEAETQLYHHCDGHPAYMLPLIEKARKLSERAGRCEVPNKMGAIVCAVDPFDFHLETASKRPDAGHGDLEYIYTIGAARVEKPPGCRKLRLIWPVTVGDGKGRKIMGAILLGVPGELARFV